MTERLPIETRQAGDRLIGEVVYNREALDRPEMFEPGAFVSVSDPLLLRLQHDRVRSPAASTEDGTLTVLDTATSLKLEARLRPGSAEHQLVSQGCAYRSFCGVCSQERNPQQSGAADHPGSAPRRIGVG